MKIKTHINLIKCLRKFGENNLPDFFGFKDAGVLFFDKVSGDLYTAALMGNDNNNKTCLIGLDSQSTIRFPSTLGITGKVFKEKTIIFSNSAKNDSRFNPDIDNISSESDVRNFMIGVILGEDGVQSGVIQFINKK